MTEVVQLRCVEGAPLTRVVEADRLDPKQRRAKLKAREAQPPPRPRSARAHPSAQQQPAAPSETVRSYWASSDPVEVFKRRSEPTPLMQKQMRWAGGESSRAPRALRPEHSNSVRGTGGTASTDAAAMVECCGSTWGVATG